MTSSVFILPFFAELRILSPIGILGCQDRILSGFRTHFLIGDAFLVFSDFPCPLLTERSQFPFPLLPFFSALAPRFSPKRLGNCPFWLLGIPGFQYLIVSSLLLSPNFLHQYWFVPFPSILVREEPSVHPESFIFSCFVLSPYLLYDTTVFCLGAFGFFHPPPPPVSLRAPPGKNHCAFSPNCFDF